jgi:hypothetical protein
MRAFIEHITEWWVVYAGVLTIIIVAAVHAYYMGAEWFLIDMCSATLGFLVSALNN